MKVIILAAGQGTRLRPMTDNKPKCMVELNGKALIDWQIETLKKCGVREKDIYIVTGYKEEVLHSYFKSHAMNFITNKDYMTTNMVCSLMCARKVLENESDVIVAYGDIIYSIEVLKALLSSDNDVSIVIDEGWYKYWEQRCTNPLDDAETLRVDKNGNLLEIGQKTEKLSDIQAQYIGLMRFRNTGLKNMLQVSDEANRRTSEGETLWRTSRVYSNMYMTDLLQGMIEEGYQLKGVQINRGWFEIDCQTDLQVAEKEMSTLGLG